MLIKDIHSTREAFLAAVHDFAIETGISESQLSLAATGSTRPLYRLRNGKSITLRTADRIYVYMAAERARRAEPGARRSTACQEGACLSEAEAQGCEAVIEGKCFPKGGWRARFLAWFRP